MARTGLLLRVTPEERALLGQAAAAAGEPVAEWIRDVAVQAAQAQTTPPAPAGPTKEPTRPLSAVPNPRQPAAAVTPPTTKGQVVQHGMNSAALSHRPLAPTEDTGIAPRCSEHKKLETDNYPACWSKCRAEWGEDRGSRSRGRGG